MCRWRRPIAHTLAVTISVAVIHWDLWDDPHVWMGLAPPLSDAPLVAMHSQTGELMHAQGGGLIAVVPANSLAACAPSAFIRRTHDMSILH